MSNAPSKPFSFSRPKVGYFSNRPRIIVCIPKTPQPNRPEEYRHLTLLNADLILLARNLTDRMSPWLTSLLHPSQHCRTHRKTIFDASATVSEAIVYTEHSKQPLCILSIDFKEAFDSISHAYIFTLVTTYGFSARFKACIQGMYSNTTSFILINGHTSGTIPIKSSVRQGCPLSMQLFTLCLGPLLRDLEKSLTGTLFGNNNTKTAVITYAEDVTLLVTSLSELPRFRTIIDQYGAASGAKINISKSKALAVGEWDTSVDIIGIQYHREMKIRGAHFTNSVKQSAQKSWTKLTGVLRSQAINAYSMLTPESYV